MLLRATFILVFSLLVFDAFSQCTITENGHAFKVKITIDNTKVEGSGSHTNIPVLISHTDANMKTVANGGYVKNANGYDIVFTNSAGTQIDHQLVSYNASTGAIEAWVEVPSLSTSSDTDIYIYFGNDDISTDPSTSGTFSSNYEGVYLLDEDPSSSVTGYTSNANSLTSSGSMTSGDEVSAKVGNGLDFDGTDDYVSRTYDSDFDFGTGSFSVSGWIKTAGSTRGTPTDFSARISSGADDVEESGSDGNMYDTSTDLEIVDDGSSSRANQTIGLRFNSITIPQGSTINSASIVFTGDGSSSGTCNLTIKGNDADNASAIGTSAYYLTTGITLTSASASWSPASSWSNGVTYTTSDISGIVQEIVDRGGWSSSNSMLFTISGSGISDELRRAFSYEGSSSDAPLLQINYGGASDMTILSRYDDDQGFKLYMDTAGKIHFGVDDDGTWGPDFKVSSSSAYDDDTWHYVTGVKYDDDSIALFVDGIHIDGISIVTAAAPISRSVSASSDDVEEDGDDAGVDLSSGDLEMEDDEDTSYPHYKQTIGIRFQTITIAAGTTIDSAFVRFHADGNENNTTNLTVHGHDTANAVTFTSDDYDVTSRSKTSAAVSWNNVESWSDLEYYNTPDLKSIVQEIVDRGDWSSGNAMAFIIDGSKAAGMERRNAHSFDNSGGNDPPELLIYTGSTPMATLTSDSAPFTIGSDEPTNGKYFDGIIDEVRVANTAWDAGYIATEYNSVSSPSTFYSTTADAPDTSYYWTGTTSTAWNTASNWTPATVPSAESTVVIKDVTNDPVLDADAEINTLYIKSGAVFNSGAYNLSVYEELINDGTFNAGTGTVTFNLSGDQDICQNSFNNLVLGGSGKKSLTTNIDVNGDLTLSGTAQLDVSASDYTINLAGNWDVSSTHADPFLEQGGTVILDGSGAQSISHSGTGNEETFNSLTIDKAANDITLLFPITINGTLRFLTGGKIILGTHDLTIGSSGSVIGYDASKYVVAGSTGTLRQQNIGSGGRTGGIVFPVGFSTASYTPATIDNTSGTADRFDVNICEKIYDDGNCSGGTEYTTMVVDKTWHIGEGTPGGSNAAITLQWNGTDEQSFDNSNCVISHFTGGAWVPEMTATSALGSDPYTLTASGINSFSPFGVGDNPGLLPVQLLYFRGALMDASVQLTWATATETNNDYFTLERSSNGLEFEPIARINGAGNSKSKLEYTHSDKDLSGNILYYRLKQTDFDGKFEYFNVIAVDISSQQQALRIYPNPAVSELHLDGQLNEEVQMTLTLADVMGNTLFEEVSSQYGHFERLIDVSRYPAGLYWIKVNINGQVSVSKIVIGID